ncbi:MAG: 16S rRNA (guanine(527)-N(7))-methyltransferase RsmG [Dehalococcoidia bacterium]|nr:MAG: 16S rRNA (guanine(527)-N(7))-methyltransferase RsmG [Dehalococcoidia bacterium]
MELLIAGASRLDLELNPGQISCFQAYYEELADWNSRINLTAITDYHDVQVKHFLDSLTVVLALPKPLPADFKLIDVGSGGGFPGLPIKIMFSQIELVLLESTNKKADFLRHMVQRLGLERVKVVTGRAEETAHLPDYREQFYMAVARGLAEMAALAELTLPFCRVGGRLIAQKKGDIAAELSVAVKAVKILGGGTIEAKSIEIPEFTDSRCLVIVEKVEETPPQYPRRPGIPAKRPL